MALERLKFKFHSLTGRITSELVRKAFKAVRRNRGAAGLDKVSVSMYEANLDQNLGKLMRDLKSGSYRPLPVRRVYIPKSDGRQRPLGIPAVRDRVAQEVLRQLLDPIFEPTFHENSYGFRKRRNAHQAIERVKALAKDGHRWVVDADIKGFFDEIPHDLIMRTLNLRVADGTILGHVEKCLKAGVMEDGRILATRVGTPQGGVISPLLANVVLNHLDWALQDEGYEFVRYADDFVVMCRTRTQAEKARAFVERIVEGRLKLTLHPEKTRVVQHHRGFDFLGFTIGQHRTQMRERAVEAFKTKVRGLTVRSHNLDAEVIVKLNRVIRGTLNYFGAPFATGDNLFRGFDKWIRKRLRCMRKKRIRRTDNRRIHNHVFARMGLLNCQGLFRQRRGHPAILPGRRGNLTGAARC